MTDFQPETQRYTAIPKYNKSFSEVGEYTKLLSTGKVAMLKFTTEWRWGQCVVEITKKEYAEIIKSDSVCLTDYHCEFEESTDGWSDGAMVPNEESYTIEEMREIIKSSYDPGESSDDESDEEEQEPTICTDDCACDKHSKKNPTVVERDEHGNYNVTVAPPIENDEELTLDDCTTDGLSKGGWDLDETYYYIYEGVVLVPEGEDIDDYEEDDGSYANKEDPVSVLETINIHI